MTAALDDLRRLLAAPLPGDEGATVAVRLASARGAVLPGLSAAHAGGRPVVVCWMRLAPGAPLQVLMSPDLVPPGATDEPACASAFARFALWRRCTVLHDPLRAGDDPSAEPTSLLEDLTGRLGDAPFAWLVRAEPVGCDRLDELLDELHHRMSVLLDRERISGRDAIALERVRGRYRELARGVGGVWRVTILAGGGALAAALLASAGDLAHTPYALRPSAPVDLDAALTSTAPPVLPAIGGAVPAEEAEPVTSGELLAVLARAPVRELPGVRAIERAEFDLTPETAAGIPVGDVLDRTGRPAGAFRVPLETLNRHAFVAGATGSGKSQTIRHLLEGLHDAQVPWLVIEPAKAEYAGMAGRLAGRGEVAVIRPGAVDAVPLGVNPLEPAPGFPLQTHLDLVRALFLAAFEAHEPFPQVLAQALTRTYAEHGWELATGDHRQAGEHEPGYPTLGDLQRAARAVVADIGYGAELAADVGGFVDVRLGSLRLGSAGRFLDGGYPLDIADLLARDVVLELEDVGSDEDKAFCIGAMLIRVAEHLRVGRAAHPTGGRLHHVTVVEEAHRLLRASAAGTPAGHAVELFAALLAEVRAYGEGVVVAEQIPSKLAEDVIKNSALKLVHRLPAADDRDAVGATMNLDERQSRHVVSLEPGQAAAFADGMDRPVLVGVPLGEAREQRDPRPPRVAIAGDPEDPCTLRDIAAAQRVAEDPRLILWIELLCVAHLTGDLLPTPDPGAFAALLEHRPRVIGHAIEALAREATACRAGQIRHHYLPSALAEAITRHALAALDTGIVPSRRAEPRWQAGRYRWADVARALLTSSDPARDRPHPDTATWAARGLELPGEGTIDDQLDALRNDGTLALPERPLIHGDQTPSPIERAAARLSAHPDPAARLWDATRFLARPAADT